MGRLALLLRTALAPAAWGTTYLITMEFLPTAYPLWDALLRALPAGVVLLAVRRELPHGQWWWRSLVLGTLNIGGFFALLFVAASRLPGGVAATLNAVQTLLVVGLAAVLLGDRVRAPQLAAALAGVGGVALLVLRGTASLDPVGVAAGLGTAVFTASGIVLTRRWGPPARADGSRVDPLTATAWQLLGGSVVLAALAVGVEGGPPHLGWAALGGLAWLSLFGTAVAYVLFFAGLHRLPASGVSVLALVSPLVATTLGWVVLGQSLTLVQGLGAALVLGSVVVGQRVARSPARPLPAPQQSDDSRPAPAEVAWLGRCPTMPTHVRRER